MFFDIPVLFFINTQQLRSTAVPTEGDICDRQSLDPELPARRAHSG